MLDALVDDASVPVNSRLDPGKAFDRIMDRTGGRPGQSVDVSTDGRSLTFVLKPPDVRPPEKEDRETE